MSWHQAIMRKGGVITKRLGASKGDVDLASMAAPAVLLLPARREGQIKQLQRASAPNVPYGGWVDLPLLRIHKHISQSHLAR